MQDSADRVTGAPAKVFTDGACLRNGRSDAAASYACYVAAGVSAGRVVSGRVPPYEFRMVSGDPCDGFAADPAKAATPTNNRGEYLAWCHALHLLLADSAKASAGKKAEVVSDCNLFIQTMKVWLPARRKKNTEAELKNYDLVKIGSALLDALRANGVEVVMTHIRSHQKRPADAGTVAYENWAGNDRADLEAKKALQSGS